MDAYRVRAEIDLDALTHNLAAIRRRVGPGVAVMLVVKADAYGHGAVAIAHHALRCGIAAFGVGSLFGLDFTGAREMTETFKGRLAMGTWIHNNPNSLGHTVILAIPLVYFALFWRSAMSRKLLALGLAAMAAYCVYKTASRGAFIAGLAVVSFGLTLGRPKFVQLMVAVFVITSVPSWAAYVVAVDASNRSAWLKAEATAIELAETNARLAAANQELQLRQANLQRAMEQQAAVTRLGVFTTGAPSSEQVSDRAARLLTQLGGGPELSKLLHGDPDTEQRMFSQIAPENRSFARSVLKLVRAHAERGK